MLPFLVIVVAVVSQASAGITPLTDADRALIVKDHNDYRAKQPAKEMAILSWDSDLASQAQAWTDQCVFQHQHGRPWGENIAAESGQPDNTAAINYMFNLWVAEEKYNTDNEYTCCSMSGASCCHLTQVIWAKTTKVGCGLTLCPVLTTNGGPMHNAAYLACYYEPKGNFFMQTCNASGCHIDYKPYVHT